MINNKQLTSKVITTILYKELNNYLQTKQIKPNIVNITIGNNYANELYAKMKEKTFKEQTTIKYNNIHFDQIAYNELINYIKELNNDKEITGVMLQLPLPEYLKPYEREILDTINPSKDIDGLTTKSQEQLKEGIDTLIPCTSLGIDTLLKSYNISLNNKQIAIINRSNIVGIPLYYLMLRNEANPIICHSRTINLASITSKCDIVIAALNKKEYITSEYLQDGAIVIDVGTHKNNQGNVVGDVDYKEVYDKVSLITPPIGAVGPMTICMLAYNSAKAIYAKEIDQLLNDAILIAAKTIERGK